MLLNFSILVLRLEVDINPKYRYVDSQKLKYRIRRACNRAGIPVRTDVAAASDKILEKAWYSGKEMVSRAEWYSGEIKPLRQNFEYVLYSITLNSEDFSYSTARDEIVKLNTSDEYLIKLKVKSKTKRDSFEIVEINAKEMMYKVFARDNMDRTWTLFMALSENMTPYDFVAALLHTAKRKLYNVNKLGL